jgi:hypothetical protein
LISIIDNTSGHYGDSYHSLQGRYSPFLFGGNAPSIYGGPTSATISQTGLVPIGTTFLLMDVHAYYVQVQDWSGFTVSLGGQTINMAPFLTFPSYTQYRGEISAFAGQTAQLSITAPPTPYGSIDPNGVLIDDIRFVPEPSAFGLSALGALLVGWRLMRRRGGQSGLQSPGGGVVCR